MTTKENQAELSTGEACPGCGGEAVLMSSDDGSVLLECACSSTGVLVAV